MPRRRRRPDWSSRRPRLDATSAVGGWPASTLTSRRARQRPGERRRGRTAPDRSCPSRLPDIIPATARRPVGRREPPAAAPIAPPAVVASRSAAGRQTVHDRRARRRSTRWQHVPPTRRSSCRPRPRRPAGRAAAGGRPPAPCPQGHPGRAPHRPVEHVQGRAGVQHRGVRRTADGRRAAVERGVERPARSTTSRVVQTSSGGRATS